MGTSAHAEDMLVTPRPPPPATATVELAGNGTGSVPADEIESEETLFQRFSNEVDALVAKADELENRVKEVSDFFANKKQPNNLKGSSGLKDKIEMGRKELVCSRRMQEVMRQFGTILKQLSQHKWAWPFMEPVDVEGLGLDDYYEIVKKPMDFTTIRKRMDANVYKNVREIYADVRLVFSNAMTYNDDVKSDVHVMAKTLLEKFEEKWLQILPKVIEAETRQKEEEEIALATMQITQEVAIGKLAKDTNNELNKLNLHLEEIRESVLQKCRKMSLPEKRKLSSGITSLTPDYLYKAVEIVSNGNPIYESPSDVVEIDIDTQNEITLWRLQFFVKGALESQSKSENQTKSEHQTRSENPVKNYAPKAKNQAAETADESAKRKKQLIYDALAKTARKRSRKLDP